MTDYGSKYKVYLGTKKKLRGKVGHIPLCTLSPITNDGDG